jgi:hypothetical protein
MTTAPTILDMYRAGCEVGSTAKGWRHKASILRSHSNLATICGEARRADYLTWLADDCEARAAKVEAAGLVWGAADVAVTL